MISKNLERAIARLKERDETEQNEIAALILEYLDGDFSLGDLTDRDLEGVKDAVRAIAYEYA